jgi:hypothetical protein
MNRSEEGGLYDSMSRGLHGRCVNVRLAQQNACQISETSF